MSSSIYDKTDKGREEISTRQYHLPSRLRSLLVLVDGKASVEALLKKIVGLGLDLANIEELEAQGFIVKSSLKAPDIPVTTAVSHSPEEDTDLAQNTDEGAAELPAVAAMDDTQRFQALYNFFNTTIKSTLGLRGFTLQLKVERAATIQDFHELRRPYIEAISKAKGREMAISLRDRLDQLLFTRSGERGDKIIADE
jgi:hypothetical protein